MTRFADREIPAGVSYRQLDHWCRQGWISKRLAERVGTGFRRSLNIDEIEIISMAAPFVRDGVVASRAFEMTHALRRGEAVTIGGYALAKIPDGVDRRSA